MAKEYMMMVRWDGRQAQNMMMMMKGKRSPELIMTGAHPCDAAAYN